jgi:hypothetical protein
MYIFVKFYFLHQKKAYFYHLFYYFGLDFVNSDLLKFFENLYLFLSYGVVSTQNQKK